MFKMELSYLLNRSQIWLRMKKNTKKLAIILTKPTGLK